MDFSIVCTLCHNQQSHCDNAIATIQVALCREFNWLSFVAIEIMDANGCTFVFSIFSAKHMYFVLENQNKVLTRQVFANYFFGQVEVVKWK